MSQPAFDFGDEPYDDPTNPTYTVGELADAINRTLRRGFSDGVWVRGEIHGWRVHREHAYFQLVERDENGTASIEVQFFANVRAKLLPMLKKHRLRLGDGMKVRIFGHLDFYPPSGRLGLKMSGLDPRFTLGEMAIERDEVIRRIVAAGLLDANKRKGLSPVPLRVGVVASVGTAAWHDFHHEIERSGLGFRLSVVNTKVQGEWAAEMVAASIRTLARRGDLDTIVLIRGGGSRNELATFDAEAIARAVATSALPVLTGLGHEIDRSVADEVAHSAYKTPTACAGALVERVRQHVAACEGSWASIQAVASAAVVAADARLGDRAHRIARRTHGAIDRADDRLAARVDRLQACAPRAVVAAQASLSRTSASLARRVPQLLAAEERHLASLAARVATLDPAVLLARGWSITRGPDGRVVRSVAQAPAGTLLATQVADGTVTSRVEEPR